MLRPVMPSNGSLRSQHNLSEESGIGRSEVQLGPRLLSVLLVPALRRNQIAKMRKRTAKMDRIYSGYPACYLHMRTRRSYPTLTTSHCPCSVTIQQSRTTSLEAWPKSDAPWILTLLLVSPLSVMRLRYPLDVVVLSSASCFSIWTNINPEPSGSHAIRGRTKSSPSFPVHKHANRSVSSGSTP